MVFVHTEFVAEILLIKKMYANCLLHNYTRTGPKDLAIDRFCPTVTNLQQDIFNFQGENFENKNHQVKFCLPRLQNSLPTYHVS